MTDIGGIGCGLGTVGALAATAEGKHQVQNGARRDVEVLRRLVVSPSIRIQLVRVNDAERAVLRTFVVHHRLVVAAAEVHQTAPRPSP